jgi:hypothetical protein
MNRQSAYFSVYALSNEELKIHYQIIQLTYFMMAKDCILPVVTPDFFNLFRSHSQINSWHSENIATPVFSPQVFSTTG